MDRQNDRQTHTHTYNWKHYLPAMWLGSNNGVQVKTLSHIRNEELCARWFLLNSCRFSHLNAINCCLGQATVISNWDCSFVFVYVCVVCECVCLCVVCACVYLCECVCYDVVGEETFSKPFLSANLGSLKSNYTSIVLDALLQWLNYVTIEFRSRMKGTTRRWWAVKCPFFASVSLED